MRRNAYERFMKHWDSREKLPWPIRWFSFLDLHRVMGLRFWSFIVGGASLDPETHEFWRRTVFAVFQGYGLTETAPIVTMFNPFKHPRDSVGEVMPDQEIRLAPDGEILVRGGNVMQGYFADEDGTDAILVNGWLHTGDIGEMDPDGHIFIRGRKKEMILSSDGHNIYPSDIEHALNAQPGVRESVVFGRPGPSGESVHAVLLLESGTDGESIVAEANRRLGPHQRIKNYTVWEGEDFPRTATMKIRKGEVRKAVMTGTASEPSDDDLLTGLTAVGADRNARLLEDLGLDSLDMVELVTRVEKRFGVSLDESFIGPDTTVGDLEALASHSSAPAVSAERSGETPAPGRKGLPMPRWNRRLPARLMRAAVTGAALIPLFRLFCRVEASGLENLHTFSGPCILCANHQSDLDPLAILSALPYRYRGRITPAMGLNRFHAYFTTLATAGEGNRVRSAQAGKSTEQHGKKRGPRKRMNRFLHHLSYGLISLLFQTFPFPQGTAFRPSLEYTGELLDEGHWVLIFPEGRVSRNGDIGTFRGGVSLIAQKTEAPVLPVLLQGMDEVLPPGHWFPRRGIVRVVFGRPVPYEAEGNEVFAARLRSAVEGLKRETNTPKGPRSL
jgi:long-chain acyl-CoA synthetase